MMKKLLEGVTALTLQELALANKDHGDRFHSLHEGYGVLREELDEARVECLDVSDSFTDVMYYIRTKQYDALRDCLIDVNNHAKLAACEYIQVAAMCDKMLSSMEVTDNAD